MWGDFPEVRHPQSRNFVRAYWRFLLGWGPAPRDTSLPARARQLLRLMARTEITAYRKWTKQQPRSGKVISLALTKAKGA